MISDHYWREAIDQLPLGVLLLDRGGRVRAWNGWLAEKTGMAPERVLGRTLAELFPGFNKPRFDWALDQVFASGSPQLLSQTLNRYLIPISLRGAEQQGLTLMQQQVQLSPLAADEELCLVSISDVTANVMRASAVAEMAKALQEASVRDPLTALYNRRFMWEWLAHELKQAQRHGYPLSCLLLDIDHFKAINDTLGHDAGDRVLTAFAALVGAQVRASDVLVRYGGEEFVVLLPHCDLHQGVVSAEKIVQAVRASAIGGLEAGRVTCSIGVAAHDPAQPLTGEELLKQADLRLYQAKASGRDRVCAGQVPQVAAPIEAAENQERGS